MAMTKRRFPRALGDAERVLNEQPAASGGDGARDEPPRSLEMGLAAMPAANLALISTPGDYAAAEAIKALHLGLNVMLFSDNVPVADEVALKRYAQAHDLIVMGPDCGTAIVNGIPLGFANAVRRGDIGLVGASGTGLQQVTCLIDRFGAGVSQALGTGGHDLSQKVGGITMLQGLSALAADHATKAIVLISKPPAEEIAELVLAKAQACGKPVIVNFLGADPELITAPGITAVKTLEDTAIAAARLVDRPTTRLQRALGPSDRHAGICPRAALCARPLQRRHALLRGDHAAVRSISGSLFEYAGWLRAFPRQCLAEPRAHADRSRR